MPTHRNLTCHIATTQPLQERLGHLAQPHEPLTYISSNPSGPFSIQLNTGTFTPQNLRTTGLEATLFIDGHATAPHPQLLPLTQSMHTFAGLLTPLTSTEQTLHPFSFAPRILPADLPSLRDNLWVSPSAVDENIGEIRLEIRRAIIKRTGEHIPETPGYTADELLAAFNTPATAAQLRGKDVLQRVALGAPRVVPRDNDRPYSLIDEVPYVTFRFVYRPEGGAVPGAGSGPGKRARKENRKAEKKRRARERKERRMKKASVRQKWSGLKAEVVRADFGMGVRTVVKFTWGKPLMG